MAGEAEPSRRTAVLVGLVAAVVFAAGVGFAVGSSRGGQAPAPAPATDGSPSPSPAPAPAPAPLGAADGGQGVVVDAVELDGDDVRLTLTATNPSTEERRLAGRFDPPLLGEAHGPEEDLVLAPLTSTRLVLSFPGPVAGPADLRFNTATDALDEPAITVPAVPLDATRSFTRPTATATAPRDAVAQHPSGVTVTLRTLTADADGIAVSLLVVNGTDDEVRLGADPPALEAPSGRRFPAVPATANPELRVPAGQRLTGTLRFPGPLPEDVDQLALVLNDRRGADDDRARIPRLRLDPVRVRPPQAAAVQVRLPPARDLDVRADHPGGVSLTVRGVSFHEDRIQLEVTATNAGGADVRLGEQGVVLRDDLGTTHRLSPPPADPDLRLAAGATTEGTLVFPGRLAPRARTLTLVTNARASNTIAPTTRPTITVPDLPTTSPGPTPAATPAPDTVSPTGAASSPTAGRGAVATPTPGAAGSVAPADRSSGPLAPSVSSPAPATGRAGAVPLPRSEVRIAPQIVSELVGGAVPGDDQVGASAATETERTLADLGAQHTPEGLVVTLPETVLFDFDQAAIRPSAEPTLARIADVLTFYADTTVEVRGHTDTQGDDTYNQDLSQRRATTVRDALTARFGIAATRLTARGLGEQQPIAPEDDPDGRQANRRVEIVVLQA